jgi:hypothetical protein
MSGEDRIAEIRNSFQVDPQWTDFQRRLKRVLAGVETLSRDEQDIVNEMTGTK